MPGFTDSEGETRAVVNFIECFRIDRAPWRNLSYDPLQYFRDLGIAPGDCRMPGMKEIIEKVQKNSRAFARVISTRGRA